MPQFWFKLYSNPTISCLLISGFNLILSSPYSSTIFIHSLPILLTMKLLCKLLPFLYIYH